VNLQSARCNNKDALMCFEIRVLRVEDVIRGFVVELCVCVCVCVLGVFWVKKKESAVRVARKAKPGMDVHRSIPKM
jgi:hypothetical protein